MADTEEDLRKILSSASLILVGTIFGKLVALVERVIIGRVLTPQAYGEFNIALAVMTLGATVSLAGYHQGITRFIPRADTVSETRGIWVTGLLVTVPLSLVVSGLLVLAKEPIVSNLFEGPESSLLFVLFVISIPGVVLFRVGVGTIRGFENTKYRVLARSIVYPGSRLLILSILLGFGIGIISTGISYIIAAIVTSVVSFLFLGRVTRLLGSFELSLRELTTFSAPLIVSTVMSILLTKTDTVLLGLFRTSEEVGIYSAAYPLANLLVFVLGVFGYMYLPVASRLDSGSDRKAMNRVYQMTTKWVYILTFPLFLTYLVIPAEILALLFGPEYSAGDLSLMILSIGFFANAAVGRNRETVSAMGYTNFLMITNIGAFILNVFANIVLIPQYGMLGAAIASAGAFVLMNTLILAFLGWNFGIYPFNSTSLRAIIGLPVILIPTGFTVEILLPKSIIGHVIFIIFCLFGTISSVIILGAIEKEDLIIIEYFEESVGHRFSYIRKLI